MPTDRPAANPIVVLPAIDLRGGRCVRLRQGRADEETTFSDDPVAMARRWAEQGARWMHVVDLDGAFEGRPVHTDLIARMVDAAGIPVEVGGGLRTDADIDATLAAGAARVILGTRVCADPDDAARLAGRYGDRLAVGIDARDGIAQVRGWTEGGSLRAVDLARRMERAGVRTLIVTDIGRDGMMQGVNTAAMAEVCDAVSCRVIASGGVATLADMTALRALGRVNLWGAIVGRALYENTVTVPALLAAARGAEPSPA